MLAIIIETRQRKCARALSQFIHRTKKLAYSYTVFCTSEKLCQMTRHSLSKNKRQIANEIFELRKRFLRVVVPIKFVCSIRNQYFIVQKVSWHP